MLKNIRDEIFRVKLILIQNNARAHVSCAFIRVAAQQNGSVGSTYYHIYKAIWMAAIGEVLHCRRDPEDRYAIAVIKNETITL